MKIYVAAPYADAEKVREVHAKLRSLGFETTSAWAEEANGPEALDVLTLPQIREIAIKNDLAVKNADVVLVMSREGAGAETYAEARFALVEGKGVVWLGRRSLSAYRHGVVRVDSLDDAFAELKSVARWVD